MNYNEFIKSEDVKLATMSDSEKEKWIHNLARTIQEDERCKFLNSLNGDNNCGEIIHDLKEIQGWCEKIQNGDIYCQATANLGNNSKKIMSKETAERAVDIAMQSPSQSLTFEFEGGEPLMNFETLKHIVKYSL